MAVLDAPSNLGLQPPTPGSVPGCAKAPGALRDHNLVARLAAADAGCVTPPRYDPGDWRPGDGVCQAVEVADYSRRLADRLGVLLDADRFPVVLGGDCSILLGSALALRRRGVADGRRYGLVFIDGHTDFRHPGNAQYVGAAAGEDLALVTGRGQSRLTDIERLRPYLRESDVVVLGIRDHDEYRMDITAAGIPHRTVPVLRTEGMPRTAAWAVEMLADTAGFWVHLDTDVLDPTVLPAVDAPTEGGIGYGELENLLADLVAAPACLGIEVTVFDPDYDLDGEYARELTDALVAGLRPLWSPYRDWSDAAAAGYALDDPDGDTGHDTGHRDSDDDTDGRAGRADTGHGVLGAAAPDRHHTLTVAVPPAAGDTARTADTVTTTDPATTADPAG
ncbi:MAG: arginase family protein, partial [Actinocatenispora sp.]